MIIKLKHIILDTFVCLLLKFKIKLQYLRALLFLKSFRYLKVITISKSFPRKSIFIPRIKLKARDALIAEILKKLFNKHGSDKSLLHDYQIPYGYIFNLLPSGPLLEIGIGSQDTKFNSVMGISYVPGASLRSWRDSGYFTYCYGADIDEKVIFTEDKISTYVADQLKIGSLQKLNRNLKIKEPQGFSLIIDDGYHDFNANKNSFLILNNLIMKNGFYVIEDLNDKNLFSWLDEVEKFNKEFNWFLWLNGSSIGYLIVFQKK